MVLTTVYNTSLSPEIKSRNYGIHNLINFLSFWESVGRSSGQFGQTILAQKALKLTLTTLQWEKSK